VIDPERVAGRVEIDGARVRMTDLVSDGDHLTLIPGQNRTEPVVRRRESLDGRQVADPEFDLSTWHVTRIDVMGRISHLVVSTRYVTTGKAVTPNAVALTFDDGPNPTYTPKVLRVLQRYDVPATFFTVGYLVREFPFLVEREERLGMTVANHSWDHPLTPAFKDLGREKATAEMERANRELESLGVTPTLFRPPGGSFDPELVAAADAAGMRIVLWDIDPRDWAAASSPGEIVRNVLAHVRAGSIVELHDGGGDRSATVKALPRIIRGIRKMGYELVAL
jgi:peptidoglycan/xylan/chitin deacetylase (PgdA/CDA1 family)